MKRGAAALVVLACGLLLWTQGGVAAEKGAVGAGKSPAAAEKSAAAVNKAPAIRDANDRPEQVNTGKPINNASLAVVPALNGKLSKNKSAIK